MAQAVELLEEHGLVERRPDPTDRRAKLVVLTPAGWDALRHGHEVATAIHERWTELLGRSDMLRLVTLLERLADALDAAR
jgi:DNA-binding MarR family transcriptional regulator